MRMERLIFSYFCCNHIYTYSSTITHGPAFKYLGSRLQWKLLQEECKETQLNDSKILYTEEVLVQCTLNNTIENHLNFKLALIYSFLLFGRIPRPNANRREDAENKEEYCRIEKVFRVYYIRNNIINSWRNDSNIQFWALFDMLLFFFCTSVWRSAFYVLTEPTEGWNI